jgi:eukaryotic-like serine/threonine-protein kinase
MVSGSNLTRIGKYEVTGILGRGGMGRVYRAFDRQLGRDVAIKTLTEGFMGDSEMLERFYREAAKTGMLKHPNIVTVYDLGEQDGSPYIVMEYVAGEALDKVIQSNRPLSFSAKLGIIEQVCHALDYAHRNDVIHRDVKPANVILQPDGVVKLLDFGIARQDKHDRGLTRTGSVIGTIHYMAPERLRNQPFDGRSDLFSTGVMLYQLLTGQFPFPGEDYSAIQKILGEPYSPLTTCLRGYPAELDAIVARSLEKDPDNRYSSGDEMASDLAAVSQQLKKEQVAEMFQEAEQLANEQEYTKAREILLRVAKLDAQHVGARQLMVRVQQSLLQRQRAAQIQQLRSQAEEAKLEKRFADAVAFMEQAAKMDPTSADLAGELEALRQKKRRYEQVDGYLRQVDGARQKGDFERAKLFIAQAIEVDKDDSRVRSIYSALLRQAEEAAKQAKTKKLLESARSEVGARHFTAAIKILAEVEQLDAANPELIPLLNAAKAGQQQERKRRVIEQLQNEIAVAVTADEIGRALEMVNQALKTLPNEPALLQFKGQLEKQIHEYETRRIVDETVQKCRALLDKSPGDALKLAQEMLKRFPGNERLQVLQASIEEHLQRVSTEERRVRYLVLANEALNKRKYQEAVRLLENCQADGVFSDEMRGLLEFARHEATRDQRESVVESTINEAQALLAKGAHDAAMKVLEGAVRATDDPALRNLLEKVRTQKQTAQRKLDALTVALGTFLREEQLEEGVAFFKSQPAAVLQQPVCAEALKELRQARENDRKALEAIGAAYAALGSREMSVAGNTLRENLSSHPDSTFRTNLLKAYEERRGRSANLLVTGASDRAQEALAAGDAQGAQSLLDGAAVLVEYAHPEVQSKWQRLSKEAARSGILSKIGLKGPRNV